MYTYETFEENERRKQIKGRVLKVLEFDKIIEQAVVYARTSMGKEKMSLLVPTTNYEKVIATLDQTYEIYRYMNKYGKLPLSGFVDLKPIVSYAGSGGVLTLRQLLDVASFLRNVSRLKNVVSNEHIEFKDTDLFKNIELLVDVESLEKDISFAIVNDEEVNDRASETLYSIRRSLKDIQGNIRIQLERILRNSEDYVQESIITIREGRFCLPLKAECKSKIPGIIHDTSSTGQTIFVEPMAIVEANNQIRELHDRENEEIQRILEILTSKVLLYKDGLLSNVELVGEIDFVSAKAELAFLMDASKPVINNDGVIDLVNARHPLIDKQMVVPIDIKLGETYKSLIITGPNTGGKTVSLKTTGLLTMMVMAGLMIPVDDNSKISVFDRVLADIGDEQSIEQSLSTFSAHMSNVVFILKNIRGKSLVLLDELGSGTDPQEGAALAIAILEELRQANATTMATTHYKELKVYAVETDQVVNASCEFDVEKLTPTYRLIVGTPGVSNAFVISKKLGLSSKIIEKAKSKLSKEEIALENLLNEYENNNIKVNKLLKDNETLNLRLTQKEKELDEEYKKLKASKTKILNDMRSEEKELLKDKEEEINALLKELRQKVKKSDKRDTIDELDKVRRRLRAGLKDISVSDDEEIENVSLPGEPPKNVEVGAKYFVPHLDMMGTALTVANKSKKVQLDCGGLKLTVELSQLRVPDKKVIDKKNDEALSRQRLDAIRNKNVTSAEKLKVSKRMNISSEINLIGKRYDEAQDLLDAYIDDCVLGGIHQVRIVHGKGLGVLRSAVDEKLRSDSRVKDFRLGTFGEGDDGVTIAELY